jgi:hypothetical protein
VDKKFFLSTDPDDVYNSSTVSVDKMHSYLFLIKNKIKNKGSNMIVTSFADSQPCEVS